jgi:hypothetical protein
MEPIMPDQATQPTGWMPVMVTLLGGLAGGVTSALLFWVGDGFRELVFRIIPAGIMGIVFGSAAGILLQSALRVRQKAILPLENHIVFFSSYFPGLFFSGIVVAMLEAGKSV